MERKSNIVYKSWLDAAEALTDDEAVLGEVALALMRYCLRGQEYGGDNPIVRAALIQAKPLVDSNNSRTEGGRKGGRPPKTKGSGNGEAEGETSGFKDGKPMDDGNKNHRFSKTKTIGFQNKKPHPYIDKDVDADKYVDADIYNDFSNEKSLTCINTCSSGMKPDTPAFQSKRKDNGIAGQVAEIVEYYNSRVAEAKSPMPRCRTMSDRRRSAISARIREHGREKVREMIDRAVASTFLNYGATNAPVSIDWLMRPGTFPKVLDGNYDDRERTGASGYGNNKNCNEEWRRQS